MRNPGLHAALEAFTVDAAAQLAADTARGAEVPFEVVEEPGSRSPLYCYRPLTHAFIGERLSLLSELATYAPAVRALAALDGVDAYLRRLGEARIPSEPRERANTAVRTFLSRVFVERSDFGFDGSRFKAAYEELEAALYEGRCVTTVIAPLLGLALDHTTGELRLGDGLALVRGEAVSDAPGDAVWSERDQPNVLAVLHVAHERTTPSPVASARGRFRRLLTALRLFERGGYALGPLAWTRTDAAPWRPVPLGSTGRPRSVTFVCAKEDELRAFCNLIARRMPAGGEVAWALARFEMGCERLAPFEALSDYLLALRALLEPEGPASGRLAGRLAAICAVPEERARVAERTAHAIALERAVIAGLAPAQSGADVLVAEAADHLRAMLRDVVCGHLSSDLRAVADELLADAAAAIAA
ncbi:MAG: hypothetical protein JO168_07670 [Solirubrobacterales bacterium]|nr:hypothetical protein [Solirubrobacterales bacterium]MBV9714977.1 hypothetical protein [Solirubrobacterales bacterium]